MQTSVKPWQYALSVLAIIAIFTVLWRSTNTPSAPVFSADIPKGKDAEASLKVKMD